MDKVNHYVYLQLYILLPVVVLSWLFIYIIGFVSLPLALVTMLIVVADIIVDFRVNKVIGKGWLEEDLLASRTTLLKMKQTRSKQMLYSIPLLIVWWGFVCFDFYLHMKDS